MNKLLAFFHLGITLFFTTFIFVAFKEGEGLLFIILLLFIVIELFTLLYLLGKQPCLKDVDY